MKSIQTYSRETIAHGSKSFAAAARLFPRGLRVDVHGLYAWCRHCDDVIDSQRLGFRMAGGSAGDPRARLETLEEKTRAIFAGRPVDDPPFRALAAVIARHPVPEALALHHLEGFAMDVREESIATFEDTLRYSYHVAGCVGVMMAIVMGVRDEPTLDRASDLGIAFQLTNIARDVLDDARMGRCYLPAEWLEVAGVPPGGIVEPAHRDALYTLTARLVREAEPYYASAAVGIRALPLRAAWAIATARSVYRDIGRKVIRRGPKGMDRRAVTPRSAKFYRTATGLGRALAGRLPAGSPASRTGLWTRPRIALPD